MTAALICGVAMMRSRRAVRYLSDDITRTNSSSVSISSCTTQSTMLRSTRSAAFSDCRTNAAEDRLVLSDVARQVRMSSR